MIFTPHPSRGFAFRSGESRYPHLWKDAKLLIDPCLGFGGRYISDLAPGRYPGTHTGSTAWGLVGSPIGPAYSFTGNASIQQVWVTGATLPCQFAAGTTKQFTIQTYFKYNTDALHNIFWSDNPPVGQNVYGYQLYVTTIAGTEYLEVSIHDGTLADLGACQYRTQTALTSGKWHHAIITWDPAVIDPSTLTVAFTIDGKFVGTTVVGTEHQIYHSTNQNSRIGAARFMTTPNIQIAMVNIWNRRLAWREIDHLMADPLAMFRRRERAGAKGARLVTISGTALRRLNLAVAG